MYFTLNYGISLVPKFVNSTKKFVDFSRGGMGFVAPPSCHPLTTPVTTVNYWLSARRMCDVTI